MKKTVLKKIHKSEIAILDEIVRICDKHSLNYILIGGTLLGAVRHGGFIPWDDDLDIAMPRGDYDVFLKIAKTELSSRFVLDDISTNENYRFIFAKVRLKNSTFLESTTADTYPGEKGIWVDIFPLDYSKHNRDRFIKTKWARVKLLKAIYIRKGPFSLVERKPIISFLSFFYKGYSMRKMNKKITKMITSENKMADKCSFFINYGSQYGILRQTHSIDKIFPLKKMKFEGEDYSVPSDVDYVLKNIYGPNYMKLPPIEKRVTHDPKYIKFEDGEEVFFDE